MKRAVLDASAVITFFDRRPGADLVEEWINLAFSGKAEVSMSLINWGEVYYALWRDRGQPVAEQKLHVLSQFPVEIAAPDESLTRLAASFRAQYRVPYADCFAASLAKAREAVVLTSDPDFLPLKGIVPIMLLK